MGIQNDFILEEDLQRIANADLPYTSWKDKTFLVTGATGLIGSLVVRSLMHISRQYDLRLQIIALVRNPEKAATVFGALAYDSALTLLCADLSASQIHCDKPIDYITTPQP